MSEVGAGRKWVKGKPSETFAKDGCTSAALVWYSWSVACPGNESRLRRLFITKNTMSAPMIVPTSAHAIAMPATAPPPNPLPGAGELVGVEVWLTEVEVEMTDVPVDVS